MSASSLVLPRWRVSDVYALLLLVLLSPVTLLVWLFLTLLAAPPVLILRCWGACLKRPQEKVPSSCGFYLVSAVTFLMCGPIFLTLALWMPLLFIATHILTLPFALLSCKMCGVVCNNLRLLWPYLKVGHMTWNDYLRATIGAIDRESCCEYLCGRICMPLAFAGQFTFVPLVKYLFVCNPFLYTLSEKTCNQWTVGFSLPDSEVVEDAKRNVCWAIQPREERKAIDRGCFAAHYPFPHNDSSNIVMGIQHTEGWKFVMVTETTHVADKDAKPRSSTGRTPIWRVRLHYFNMMHPLTGYVEVNTRDDRALEHPMWCIVGDGRLGNLSYKSVNELFMNYLAGDVPNFIYDVEAAQDTNKTGAVYSAYTGVLST